MATTTGGTKTVLIAHASALVRDRFRAAIERAGHHAVGFERAAPLVARVRADPGRIDLVLLDLQLPGMPGLDVVRSIRALDAGRGAVLIFSGTVPGAAEVRDLAALDVAGYINEHAAAQDVLPLLAPHLFPDNFNRRGSPRVVLGIPVQYRFGNTIAAALALNLSRGGIAIRTTSPLDPGARSAVRFRLPGSVRDIDAEGRVTWSDRRVGMGIEFEKVSPASQAVIDNFVDAHFHSRRKA